LDHVLADHCAQVAFDKLCSNGADRKELEMRVLSAVRWKEFRHEDPLFELGISRRSLNKLPTSIRTIAHQMASVSGNPNLYSIAEEEHVKHLVQDLQSFADGLEA